jgi:Bacteriophage head to tail connecting protein
MAGTALATLDQAFDASQMRVVSNREGEIVRAIMALFTEMTIWRNTYAGQLEESAALIWPEHRNTFYYGSFNWPGMKKTQQQVDASGMLALHRFAAITDSLLTPANDEWHALEADDDYVMKDRDTRLYFATLTRLLFKYRRSPMANFRGQNNANWRSLGAFGNATMYIDAFDGKHYHGARGLRYRSVPLGETFFGENHQGVVDRIVRWFRMPAYQVAQRWGKDRLPQQLQAAMASNSQWPYNFLHCVRPRDDYDPQRLDVRGLPFSSHYVSIEGQCLMQPEGGYRTFPYAVSRYDQAPREVYGRGPAQMVLPALKTLNAQKATFLKQAHRAVDPVLLGADDGLTNVDFRPGAYNRGGATADGKKLIHILESGNIQIAKEMMAEERGLIDDMFLVTLFKVLSEHPSMTATQVIELVNEKGILVAPTLGRQETEYLGPMIEREIDVLKAQRLLPPPPPRLVEAGGEYQIVYTSPLAKTQRAGKSAGFMRVVETAKEIVNITQDPKYLDWAKFDVALPAIARDQSVDEAWINSEREIAAIRQARAKAQQAQMAMQNLPNQAAMISAQAKMAKAQPGVAPGQPGLGGPQSPAPGPVPA